MICYVTLMQSEGTQRTLLVLMVSRDSLTYKKVAGITNTCSNV